MDPIHKMKCILLVIVFLLIFGAFIFISKAPMADALREAIELLPRCSTTCMRTVIEQYEFITGDKP